MKTMMVGCVVVVLVFLGGCSRDRNAPSTTITGSQIPNPVAPSGVEASRALRSPRSQNHDLLATVVYRDGDGVLSDGNQVYGGGTNEVFIIDSSTYFDIVRFKSGAASRRYLRLVVPEARVDARCDDFYKLNQQPASGTDPEILTMQVRSTRNLEGYLECMTGSGPDYYVEWGNCTVLEHPAEGVWVARAEADCTARLDEITSKQKTKVLGNFSIPWRWDGVEIP